MALGRLLGHGRALVAEEALVALLLADAHLVAPLGHLLRVHLLLLVDALAVVVEGAPEVLAVLGVLDALELLQLQQLAVDVDLDRAPPEVHGSTKIVLGVVPLLQVDADLAPAEEGLDVVAVVLDALVQVRLAVGERAALPHEHGLVQQERDGRLAAPVVLVHVEVLRVHARVLGLQEPEEAHAVVPDELRAAEPLRREEPRAALLELQGDLLLRAHVHGHGVPQLLPRVVDLGDGDVEDDARRLRDGFPDGRAVDALAVARFGVGPPARGHARVELLRVQDRVGKQALAGDREPRHQILLHGLQAGLEALGRAAVAEAHHERRGDVLGRRVVGLLARVDAQAEPVALGLPGAGPARDELDRAPDDVAVGALLAVEALGLVGHVAQAPALREAREAAVAVRRAAVGVDDDALREDLVDLDLQAPAAVLRRLVEALLAVARAAEAVVERERPLGLREAHGVGKLEPLVEVVVAEARRLRRRRRPHLERLVAPRGGGLAALQ